MPSFVRPPAVAGHFYPSKPDVLRQELRTYTAGEAPKIRALGCVVPHAGYMYSGPIAGAVYSRLELPARFVILCPNHTGMGAPLAIMSEGRWRTPLGEVNVDTALAEALKRDLPLLSEDFDAHSHEHALEVQLPFLQMLLEGFCFVPIAVGISQFDLLNALGTAIGRCIEAAREPVLVIASSDMNHYESDAVTRAKDRRAIDRMLALDPRGLYDAVTTGHISMCGFGPAIAMLAAALKLGATSAQLIRYGTSGDVSGDRDMVVGYAGIAVS